MAKSGAASNIISLQMIVSGAFFPFLLVMLDVGFVNLVSIISQNPKVTAINSCIEVDLTGQVVSDSIGTRIYSGNNK